MYKRLIVLGIIGVLSVAFLMGAEKPSGSRYTDKFTWQDTVSPSALRDVDTFTAWSSSNTGKIFRCDYATDYSSVYARYLIEYTDLDTNNAGDYWDTATDSVLMRFYTSDEKLAASKMIYTATHTDLHVTAALSSTDYTWVTLSDSVLADNVYGELIRVMNDSTDTGTTVDYKVTVWYWFK